MTSTVEAPTAPSGHCAEAKCTAAINGVCAKGRETPLDCEFFELDAAPDEQPAETPNPLISLPHGRAIRAGELTAVLRHERATRVTPLGAIEAGKTTLFAVMFEFLTNRRLEGWTFVRSVTTLGFAERSHHASARSNRVSPTTPRTSGATGDQFLHLRARRQSDGALASILFADVSGEHVEFLTTTGAREPALVAALASADHVPILIDGRLAADPQTRQNAIRHAVDLVHILPDLPLRLDAQISVVLTKLDWFADPDDATEVLDQVAQTVIDHVGGTPASFAVAARPRKRAVLEPGHGVATLFNHLVSFAVSPRDVVFSTADGSAPSAQTLRRLWDARR